MIHSRRFQSVKEQGGSVDAWCAALLFKHVSIFSIWSVHTMASCHLTRIQTRRPHCDGLRNVSQTLHLFQAQSAIARHVSAAGRTIRMRPNLQHTAHQNIYTIRSTAWEKGGSSSVLVSKTHSNNMASQFILLCCITPAIPPACLLRSVPGSTSRSRSWTAYRRRQQHPGHVE